MTLVVGSGELAQAIAARLASSGARTRVVEPSAFDDRAGGASALGEGSPHSALVVCVAGRDGAQVSWESAVETPLTRAFRAIQAGAARLADGGSVVVVGSTAAFGTDAESAEEASGQAALVGFVRALALDLGQRGIRVNLVALGAGEGAAPLGGIASPRDAAGAVAYLCSADAAFVTGQCLAVDGGRGLTRQTF